MVVELAGLPLKLKDRDLIMLRQNILNHRRHDPECILGRWGSQQKRTCDEIHTLPTISDSEVTAE